MRKISSKQNVHTVRARKDGKIKTIAICATFKEARALAGVMTANKGVKYWPSTEDVNHAKANTPGTVFAAYDYLVSMGIVSAADYHQAATNSPWILQILNQGITFHLLPDAPPFFKAYAAEFFRDCLVKSVKSADSFESAINAARQINAIHNNTLTNIATERKFGSLGAGVVAAF
jgi:hypothetical protein